ncbi:hypothetical protein RISK_004159 [Rhodopirellula islandica]|uniref:Uncharacterized protein n=1 Tax=Rhodopirellula islandica TaxID=595434 RepID=A0A0J1BAN2_RHOIS|nr:hypothetical protein RISK_004159 [Rhodopirellula islandica]
MQSFHPYFPFELIPAWLIGSNLSTPCLVLRVKHTHRWRG